MEFITQAEVQRQVGLDLPFVRHEEIIVPADTIDEEARRATRRRSWNTEQEVRIRVICVAVRERRVAKQVGRHLPILIECPARNRAHLDIVPAKEPAQVLLKLLCVIQKSWVTPLGLRDLRDTQLRYGDLEQAIDIG